MWIIRRTEEIAVWIESLDDSAKQAILKGLFILEELGPVLGRPYVDSLNQSRYKNLKELRVQNRKRVFRLFFAFDPMRQVILLIGGDKRGDKRFYQKMIPIAETLYERHLKDMERNNE